MALANAQQFWRENNNNDRYVNNEADLSGVYSEKGPEMPKNIGGRRRIANYKKSINGGSSKKK
jgi:hypothetical protein